ncbi:LemA family protein [Mycoplasmopsis pullorum]|uniref:LemA family protein n=1 Tax=Mycoplasmopsis pullorum TaxID=48003 RepID=A0A1L4FSK5_9BACT|nr:LemA family protein [Mycoplasmopsis pullorum]APJ38590.1 hypothetical protein BLA55_02900 [Mycoplasmopsis pullorum]TNK92462.1 LemA family protein [Mycoplasmopsis pullorum]
MANLFDNRTEQDPKGFNPNTDNRPVPAQASGVAKFFYYLFFITIIFIVKHISYLNWFRNKQNEINQAASNIDIQLTKRSETLTKLFETVKGYAKHEKELFESVAEMRSLSGRLNVVDEAQANDLRSELTSLNNNVFGRLMMVSENYPELKANTLFQELMEESTYIEREIAASRRLYNSQVTQFNQRLFAFPTNVPASTMRLSTIPLYQASELQRKDVEIKF